MKRLIICCDGTQNSPDQIDRDWLSPTNVVKIARSIKDADEDIKQILYYDPGVGSGWLIKKHVESLSGTGISENIIEAYAFLVKNYEPGDEIYCFGFSRGAFTVRSLCGMINRCGLLTQKWLRNDYLKLVYNLYRLTRPHHDPEKYFSDFRGRYTHESKVEVKFLGVWDTVASLGFPLFGDIVFEWNQHHDISNFQATVMNACQALAIDEQRKQFGPRLLHADNVGLQLHQKWFAGAHSNVGGGYSESGLSDIALHWMIEHAKKQGLAFDPVFIDQHISPNPYGELRNSRTGIYSLLRPQIRLVNKHKIPNADLHESVIQRYMEVTTDYEPANTLLSEQSMDEVIKESKMMPEKYGKMVVRKHNKYLRKKEKPKDKPITSRISFNLTIGVVVVVFIWLITSFIWISSKPAFNITCDQWCAFLCFLWSIIWKAILIPFVLFSFYFVIVIGGFFIWSKWWQWKRRKNPMQR